MREEQDSVVDTIVEILYRLTILALVILVGRAGNDIKALKKYITGMQTSVAILQENVDAVTAENQKLKDELQKAKDYVQKNSIILDDEISRGVSRIEPAIMRVTAYDLSFASCKKYPSHPEYGIGASGVRVQEWHTVAAGPEIPFGTKIFIPALKDMPNQGLFVAEDRGSAIKEGCIDIYMTDKAMDFGVKYLDVFILDEVGQS